MKPLVFDATPLIYLGKINLIEKIKRISINLLFYRFAYKPFIRGESKIGVFRNPLKHFPEDKYTTQSVYREVVDVGKNSGRQEAFVIEKLIKNKVIKVKTPANRQYISTLRENPKIHEADADVLALATELNGMALLDDEEARGMAEIEGIEHHGTIYLLLRMMKMKLLTKEEVFAGLNEMIHMGWRCSTELYAEIMMALNE